MYKNYHSILLPLLLCIFSCGKVGETTKRAASSTDDNDGHARMVSMLDSIARTANPRDCYHLNAKKAEMMAQQLQGEMLLEQELTLRFQYGQELLYAGKTEAAIVELKKVLAKFSNQLTEQTKPIFELLALGFLRLGEQANCIDRHNAASCILPIQGEGVYEIKAGLENAIYLYEQILAAFPDDQQSRWLLNLAHMNQGTYPQGVPAQWLVPEKLFRSNADFHFRNVAIPLGVDAKGLSGGVCMEDFDGDGDLDLFITSYGLSDQAQYFRNDGGRFTERTAAANLEGIVSGLNTLHADYDNDGDRDVLILRGGWLNGGTHPNSLLQNDGTGRFTDVTEAAGLLSFHPTQTGAWADYDADGDLDLFIANESLPNKNSHPCELFRNNGDGTFTEVAASAGLNRLSYFKGCVWGDINNDRLPDLYLSNIIGDNLMFVNRGGGRFEDIAPAAALTQPKMSFPAWFMDYDNDGFEDIFVVGYGNAFQQNAAGEMLRDLQGSTPSGDWFRVYRNLGNERFEDRGAELGLQRVTYAMGCNFGDLDNDGWQDFYLGTGKPDLRALVPNRMFRNAGGTRFEEVSMSGFAHIQKGHGVAFGDVDNDGDQDIYEVMGGAYEGDVSNNLLFENPGNELNQWVCIELVGKTCNRDAIGSRIAVHVRQAGGSKRVIYASVNTGGSFGSASLQQEIGLGKAVSIEKVEVHWAQPGPSLSVYENVPMGKFVRITEGNPTVEITERTTAPLVQ